MSTMACAPPHLILLDCPRHRSLPSTLHTFWCTACFKGQIQMCKKPLPTTVPAIPSNRLPHGGGGGGAPRFWTPTTPQTNCSPEARGGARGGAGVQGGLLPRGGGGPGGWVGGGGSRWGDLGGTCPQGQALVHHRLPLPPLALPLTIPSPYHHPKPKPNLCNELAMPAMLIRLNKIPQISFMASYATSLLSILDPNNNFDPRLGLELGLGLGSPSWWNQSWFYNPF